MDRQMLLVCVVAVALLTGCSSGDDADSVAVESDGARIATFSGVGGGLADVGGGSGGSGFTAPSNAMPLSAAPPGPSGQFPSIVPPELSAAHEPEAQNAPPVEITPGSAGNPLRFDFAPAMPEPALPQAAPQQPASANPLRGARSEPRMGAAPPPTMAPPSMAAGAPPSNPAGGALPPAGGLEEMIKAFSGPAASPGASGGPAGESPRGPAAPETSRAAVGGAADMGKGEVVGGAGPSGAATSREYPEGPTFDVVEVFYGTNRQSTEAPHSDWRDVVQKFVPMATVVVMSLCVGLAASSRKSWLLWTLAGGGVAVSLGLGYRASHQALAMVRSAGKQGPRYTTQRSATNQVELGRCEITIPKTHERGELESPSILRMEVMEDAADHVILQKTERLADAQFYDSLKQRVAASERRELFVFVHGFNVSFEDAARRTAQIHHDLKFDGAPIFFSWPANDKFIFTYPADETNIAWSVPHLKQFLLSIVKESGARSINLIAHSMGNRGLAAALREIDLEMRDQSRLFNQVIMAAPDIDAGEFRTHIAPAMQRTAKRLTLYASSHDEALLASHFLHRAARAGDAGDGLIVLEGIDTIDVTAIDSSLWGHAYYGSSHPVLHDLRTLLSKAVPPSDRTWLSPAQRDGLTYWIFQPARTAGAGGEAKR